MPIAAHGRMVVREGLSLWVLEGAGADARTDYHAHHAIQVTLSLAGGYTLATERETLTGAALVAADARHIFKGDGRVAFLFVDPESSAGIALASRVLAGRDIAPIEVDALALATLSAAFEAHAPDDALMAIAVQIVAALTGPAPARTPDRRVRQMLAFADAHLDGAITLAGAAEVAGLSEGRARHLFVEQTGLPYKSYALWLRIRRAVELHAGGASLTEAAHGAGFADSAHFSRTFRRTFGLPAAALRVNGRGIPFPSLPGR